MGYYVVVLVPGCRVSREESYFTRSHCIYCAFDLDHYHDGFIVPGIWQTKSRKWPGVTQGIRGGMWWRVAEKLCVCVFTRACVLPPTKEDRKENRWQLCRFPINQA